MDDKEIVILMGLPCCGKTRFAEENLIGYKRFSPREATIEFQAKKMFMEHINSAVSFVVDDWNHTRKDREGYIGMAKARGYRVLGYYFQPDVEESIENTILKKKKKRSLQDVLDDISYGIERLSWLDIWNLHDELPPAKREKLDDPRRKVVTPKMIKALKDEMEEPSYDEGFDEIYTVRPINGGFDIRCM